jgi:MCM OB domain
VTLQSEEIGTSIRDLKSDRVGKLVKIPGIVVAATGIKAKATRITIQCRSCRTTLPNLGIRPGLLSIRYRYLTLGFNKIICMLRVPVPICLNLLKLFV